MSLISFNHANMWTQFQIVWDLNPRPPTPKGRMRREQRATLLCKWKTLIKRHIDTCIFNYMECKCAVLIYLKDYSIGKVTIDNSGYIMGCWQGHTSVCLVDLEAANKYSSSAQYAQKTDCDTYWCRTNPQDVFQFMIRWSFNEITL